MRLSIAIAMLACMTLSACSDSSEQTQESATKAAAAASAAQAKASHAIADYGEIGRPFARWDYSDKTDPMTDEVVWSARLSSKETFELGFPYNGIQSATLVLRTGHNSEREALLFVQKGQILCHHSSFRNGCPIQIRFDDGAVETIEGGNSTDESPKVVFFPDGTMDRILAAKKLRVSITLFQAGERTLTFDIAGLDKAKLGPSPIVSTAN